MNVKVKGSNQTIKLTKNDFIAAGGEGQIYSKGNVVYKVYIDPQKAIPFSKIQELSQISDKDVIKPEALLLGNKDNPIGYTMRKILDTYVLCQIFPKVFRDRENLDNDAVLKLVFRLREMIANIHKANILVVDMNEMNFLVSKDFKNIYGIDVDSYQTPSFPATAIMESIRDRHAKKFSELTDWFSFGVLSFQMFVGIHPFKGKHPTIKYPQDKAKEITERMLQNIPVFHKDVRYPNNVLPFDIIPQAYKNWYKAVFYEGKRLIPPLDAVEVVIIPTVVRVVAGDKDFDITKEFNYPEKIIEYVCVDGIRIAMLDNNKCYLNGINSEGIIGKEIAITSRNNVICGSIQNYQLKLQDVKTKKEIPCNISAEDIMSYNGRMFIKNVDSIFEMDFIEMGSNIQPVPKAIANIMEHATQLFPGMAIQNMLGKYIVSLFPSKGMHYQIKIEELDGYKIIDAKYDNKVLIIIAAKNGKYDKFILKFDNSFAHYSLRKENDINYCGINFVTLDNGVVIHIDEAENLELFSNKKDSTTVNIIDSDTIEGNMRLFKDGTKVLFSRNSELYRIKMK